MSSATVGTPTVSATSKPKALESAAESRSGIRRPSTFSRPNARAQRARTTLLSIPPERPTTAPLFRRRIRTASCKPATSCSMTSSGSISRLVGRSSGTAGLVSDNVFGSEFSLEIARDVRKRVQVLGEKLLLRDAEIEVAFDELDELEDAHGIDDARLDERLFPVDLVPLVKGEVSAQESPDLAFDFCVPVHFDPSFHPPGAPKCHRRSERFESR